jgi:hypothetical protein
MENCEQIHRHNTIPAPPPFPEFELREIELDDDGYMVDAPYCYYGIGEPLWKAISDNNDIVFRAWSEEDARERITKVIEHFVNNICGPWPDWDILPNDIEMFV